MRIEQGDLVIRQALTADAAQLAAWWNDGQVMAHAGFPRGLGTTTAETAELLAKSDPRGTLRMLIEFSGQPIGECSYRVKHNSAEIGIKICRAEYQNRGVGRKVLKLLIAYLFQDEEINTHTPLESIVLDTNLDNKRAQHVYELLGFQKTAIRANAWQDQLGEWQSCVDYALTRESFASTHFEGYNRRMSKPIGVYDSGVGGLSVLRALHAALPHEDFIYFGDQAHVPYGSRSLEELRELADGVTRYFLSRGARLMVIACNTASAAALKNLRGSYPSLPFVGMEPAVKPAAEQTTTGAVGVLATPSTLHGELYASVVERFAQGVEILTATCPGLVAEIEKGHLDTPKTRHILTEAIAPMLAKGVDTLVMGCTHFPFVIPLIQLIAGPGVRVIDPAPAVARQAARVLEQQGLLGEADHPGTTRYYTSGDPANMERLLPRLIGLSAPVEALRWQGGELVDSQ